VIIDGELGKSVYMEGVAKCEDVIHIVRAVGRDQSMRVSYSQNIASDQAPP
jgi:hypothetical protein